MVAECKDTGKNDGDPGDLLSQSIEVLSPLWPNYQLKIEFFGVQTIVNSLLFSKEYKAEKIKNNEGLMTP